MGAFYGSRDTGHVPLHIQRQLEKLLCSDTYWDYTPDMDRSPSFLGVRRGYPMAVAGTLKQSRYEHALGSFSIRWEEAGESRAATIIYLPAIRHVAPGTVTLQPEGERYTVQPIEGSPAGYMIYDHPAGSAGEPQFDHCGQAAGRMILTTTRTYDRILAIFTIIMIFRRSYFSMTLSILL